MRIYAVIGKIYEELFIQTSLNRGYMFTPNTVDRNLIIKFIKWLYTKYHENEIGADFLIQYFEFQFSHYVGMNTKFKKLIMLNWVIGPKAINRWEERNLNRKWIVKVRIREELKLDLNKAFKEERKTVIVNRKSKFVIEINSQEEIHKKRFQNTFKGFVYCQMMCTLYKPKSDTCNTCSNKEDCKIMLKEQLPEFYKLRMGL